MSQLRPLLLVVILAACGGKSQPAAGPAEPAEPEPAAGGDQVAMGAQLYGQYCAKCHGDAGQGGEKAPAVVGEGVLPLDPRPGSKRDVQFRTAADVFAWVKKTMPGDDPGSLTDEQYAAILAFDLKANGVDVTGKTIDATTAAEIVLHP